VNRATARPDPPYLRIVGELRRRITAGELRPGDRVPSTRQIAQQWGVAIATATKALATLGHEGLVRAVPRVGTVVNASQPGPGSSQHPPRRRPAPAPEQELTRARIVHAAVGVADAEGLAAVSMRRVAAELGVATMSLYRHVPSKDQLVGLMVDAAFGEAELPEPPPPGWRAQLELIARTQWAVSRRHPWIARVISLTRPTPAPNAMAHTEWALRAVDGLGLDSATMLHVAITIAGYVQATAVNLESEVEAEQDTGITSDEWLQSQEEAVATVFASGRFPTLAAVVAQPDLDLDLDTLFEFGLRLLLDGLAVRIQHPKT
jgi:AcrR family transcriptional regulator/DNA-binding transcriptional regulator YhcF (GntR family)